MATKIEANIDVNGLDQVGKAVNSFQLLKKELKDNIGILAGLEEGTAEYVKQSQKVGELKDKVNALNDAIASTSGAPIENLTNSFGLLQGQVQNLDFGGASATLSQFSGQIKSFSFKDLVGGLKSFATGLLDVGKAILANPIGLLVTAIIAAVAAYKLFADQAEKSRKRQSDLNQELRNSEAAYNSLTTEYNNYVTQQLKSEGLITEKQAKRLENQRDLESKLLEERNKYLDEVKKLVDDEDISEADRKRKLLQKESDFYRTVEQIQKNSLAKTRAEVAAEDEKEREKKKEKEKELAEKIKEDNEKIRRDIADKNIELIKDEQARELALLKLNYDRKLKEIDESKANEKLKNEDKLKNYQVYLQQQEAVDKKYFEVKEKLRQEEEAKEKEAAEQKRLADLADFEYTINNRIADTKDYQKQLDLKKVILDEQLAQGIISQNEFNTQVNALVKDSIEYQKNLKIQQQKELYDTAKNFTAALTSLNDLVTTIEINNGNKTAAEKEKAAKRQFEIAKALSIVQTTISTIEGVQNALSAKSALPEPAATIYKVSNAVAIGLAGAANIAKIASTQFKSSGGSGASSPSASIGGGASTSLDTASASFNANTIDKAGTIEDNTSKRVINTPPTRVELLEADVTKTQNKVKTAETLASF